MQTKCKIKFVGLKSENQQKQAQSVSCLLKTARNSQRKQERKKTTEQTDNGKLEMKNNKYQIFETIGPKCTVFIGCHEAN